MLIKCTGNALSDLHRDIARLAYRETVHLDYDTIEIGKYYCVYGITFCRGYDFPWYLICEDTSDFPAPHIGEFFEVISGYIPRDWQLTTLQNNVGDISILPRRWANDPAFLEKLVAGNEHDVRFFRRLRQSYERNRPECT
jgi:hypothetical protein